MKGWVCLHRQLMDHPRFRDPDWVSVWICILLKATHQPFRVTFDGREVELRPGQFVTGRNALSEATGVHASKIRRVLAVLKNDQQIELQAGVKGSIVTVLNWGLYQTSDQRPGQQVANNRPTTGQRLTTNNNSNNITREDMAGGRPSSPPRPMGTGERIGLENKVKILRERLKALESDTAEQWQRDLKPELVREKQKLKQEIQQLENQLLRA